MSGRPRGLPLPHMKKVFLSDTGKLVATLAICALAPRAVKAQSVPSLQTCLLAEDFEGGTVPTGWSIGAPVEQQDDQTGTGLGTFVDAWSVGPAPSIGTEGYFVVPDVPGGNLFALTNDDDDPCNCDLMTSALTTPSLDLSASTGSALSCRLVVHERFGGGPARIEASTDGGVQWMHLDTIPDTDGRWQWALVDLTSLDGEPDVRLRFLWSDGGGWAVGMGVDDVCIGSRWTNDAALLDAWNAHVRRPLTESGEWTFPCTRVPLNEVVPLEVTATVANLGMSPVVGASLRAEVLLDGMPQGVFSGPPQDLPVGTMDTLFLQTGWTPFTTGMVTVRTYVSSGQADEDPDNDTLTTFLEVTGPGISQGSAAWGRDTGVLERGLSNGSFGFITGNLLEVTVGGGMATGVGVAFSQPTVAGSLVRVELRDDQFAPLAASSEQPVPADAIAPPGQASFAYFPFDSPVPLLAGNDVFVAVSYSGSDNNVHAGSSGDALPGSAWMFTDQDLSWRSLTTTPLVRLYLDNAIGIPSQGPGEGSFHLWPVPADQEVFFDRSVTAAQDVELSLTDVQGRVVHHTRLSGSSGANGKHRLDIAHLPTGTYILRIASSAGIRTAPVVVLR